MGHPLSAPRPPTPTRGYGRPRPEPTGPSAGAAAAGIATGVLCLWTPFTLIIAVLLATLPQCATAPAAICTAWGHRAAMWSDTTGALLGLLILAAGAHFSPRRHQALYALAALAAALSGLLITLALANTTPAGWIPE